MVTLKYMGGSRMLFRANRYVFPGEHVPMPKEEADVRNLKQPGLWTVVESEKPTKEVKTVKKDPVIKKTGDKITKK